MVLGKRALPCYGSPGIGGSGYQVEKEYIGFGVGI